jgi:hypothetical protein
VNLRVGSRWPGAGRKRLVSNGAERGGEGARRRRALVKDGWREMAGWLHGLGAKLARGVVGVGWRYSGGSVVAGVCR